MVEGLSSKEIGLRLGLSPLTIATQRRTIFRRLGVRSAAELCLRARWATAPHTLSE